MQLNSTKLQVNAAMVARYFDFKKKYINTLKSYKTKALMIMPWGKAFKMLELLIRKEAGFLVI